MNRRVQRWDIVVTDGYGRRQMDPDFSRRPSVTRWPDTSPCAGPGSHACPRNGREQGNERQVDRREFGCRGGPPRPPARGVLVLSTCLGTNHGRVIDGWRAAAEGRPYKSRGCVGRRRWVFGNRMAGTRQRIRITPSPGRCGNRFPHRKQGGKARKSQSVVGALREAPAVMTSVWLVPSDTP